MVNVIGMGVVSCLGVGVQQNLSALLAERDNLQPPRFCPTSLRVPVGEVDLPQSSALCRQSLSRTALLAQLALDEALASVDGGGLSSAQLEQASVVSATTVGGMDVTPRFFADFISNPSRGRLRFVREHDCASATDSLSPRSHGVVRTTISTACSSGANAIMMGARLIESGLTDVAICGGTDALSQFTIDGFNSLMILSPDKCRPLSAERQGLNLGEGAAYLVLARHDSPHRPLARLSGWANANDAFHQTAISPDGRGAQVAMRLALSRADISLADVDYINLHGTATLNNDASELAAVSALWGDRRLPLLSSTKSFTGHTLAAAGAVEAVFSILSIQNGKVWANLRSGSPILPGVSPVASTVSAPVRHVLSNSLGFGGNCTSLIFSA